MRGVWKYAISLKSDDEAVFEMPEAVRVVHVGQDPADPMRVAVWAEVFLDKDIPTVKRAFRVFGTGHDVPMNYDYRGTAVMTRGPLGGMVFHVYQQIAGAMPS